jgi:hypothetical protein
VILTFTVLVSPACADTEIGSTGTGAGQTLDPRGIAVDEAEDLLYVADRGNNRIDVFDASSGSFIRAFGWGVLNGESKLQVCTTTCLPGKEGSGPGQISGALGIAVDNDSTSPGFHSIYVFEGFNRRIQKFSPAGEFVWMAGAEVNVTTGGDLCTKASGDVCGPGTGGSAPGQFNSVSGDTIDVGPGGTVFVSDRVEDAGILKTRVQLYSSAGSSLGYLGGKLLEVTGGAGGSLALAVDSAGNVYVGTAGERGAARKYDPSGNQLAVFNPSFNVDSIAVDPEDHVFVGDTSSFEGEFVSAIYEYNSAGTPLRVIYGSLENRILGLATPDEEIFAVEIKAGPKNRVLNVKSPPPGPQVYPVLSTVFAGPIGSTKATLHSKVNPEGKDATYHFEYISDTDFGAAGNSFGAGTLETPESSPLPADFKLHPIQAEITDLFPETIYHFRAVATNADGDNTGPESTFLTKEPIEFGDIWSTDVGTASANLHIEANPLGTAATGHFEYVELANYEESGFLEAAQAPAVSEEPIDLGEGEEMLDFSAETSSLQPGTSYHYRFVAVNRCKPEPAPLCEFAEPVGTFTTFLPDQAKPCPNDPFRVGWPGVEPGPGEQLPDCRAYEMVSPVDKNGANVGVALTIPGFAAGLDQAAADGESITYSSYKAFTEVSGAPYSNQYLARRDLIEGWSTKGISPKREGPAILTYFSPYLDRQYKAFSPDLCSGWVLQETRPTLTPDGVEGYAGLYQRDLCGGGSYEALTTVEPLNLPAYKFYPEFQGASADGSVAIFGINDNLTPGSSPQPEKCVEKLDTSIEFCQSRLYEVRDGQLNFVCIRPDGSPHPGDCGGGTTQAISSGGSERAGNLFNAISADGSHIFWSTSASGPGSLYVRIDGTETVEISSKAARFWKASSDGSKVLYTVDGQLYVFEVPTKTATLIAEDVHGVAGASEDLSHVYFASSKVLTGSEENNYGDEAAPGEGNLYLYTGGSAPDFEFIAALSASEFGSDTSLVSRFPIRRLSRVTPGGMHIAFMSESRLTGYDNTDAVSKQPNLEVFFYDAEADQLVCPSCNPTGARPEGRELSLKLLEERWAAARIPVFESQLYGQRVLSDDGTRLYFNSFDPLSVNDTNGQEDVYQWEAADTGSCDVDSSTYHQSAGGCIDLISSGKGGQDSELVDISADGRDVFFKTFDSLVPQDPGLRDIYDARVEGGFPYVLPAPPRPDCTEPSCQTPVPGPADLSLATRSSGPGNPPSAKPKRRKHCPKGKRKVKRNSKVICVKKHKKQPRENNKGGRGR